MSLLASIVFCVLHAFYSILIRLRASWTHERVPLPLTAKRSKTPKHLGIIFAYDADLSEHEELEKALLQCLKSIVGWAQVVGIEQLTLYDRKGVLISFKDSVRNCLLPSKPSQDLLQTARSELVYPPTPPLSDDSDSSSNAPWNDLSDMQLNVVTISSGDTSSDKRKRNKAKRRLSSQQSLDERSFALNIISRDSGKPAIAAVANHLRTFKSPETPSNAPSVADLDRILEGGDGFGPPDLIIVHHITPEKYRNAPLELHGFPPWQIRLSEIYHNHSPVSNSSWRRSKGPHHGDRKHYSVLEEVDFRRALDQFSGAEMRVGT